MSVNGIVSWCHFCRKQPKTDDSFIKYTRQLVIQLFYVLVLVYSAAMFYMFTATGMFKSNNTSVVARPESTLVVVDSIQNVVFERHLQVATLGASPIPTNTPSSSSTSSSSASSRLSPKHTTTNPPSSTTTSPSITTTSPSTTTISTSATSSLRFTPTVKPDVGKYVSFGGGFADGRGLGNQMFNLAAVIYVAELTGRQPGILTFSYKIALDEVFDLGIQRFKDLCPCYVFGESGSLWYDDRLEDLVNGSRAVAVRGQSIFLSGFFQSWKYTLTVERRLRRHFMFLPEVRLHVDKFWASSRPAGWAGGYMRVAIHVRRGDVLYYDKEEFGYTTPDENYFTRAMRYFVDRFQRVQFVVASNDIDWCRRSLTKLATSMPQRVNMTFVTPLSRGMDFAIIASCEHVIMSTGTYGWWAAWLARGITIYYKNWPRKESTLERIFVREDFFPPSWIGMT